MNILRRSGRASLHEGEVIGHEDGMAVVQVDRKGRRLCGPSVVVPGAAWVEGSKRSQGGSFFIVEGASRALTLTRTQGKEATPDEEVREAIRDAQVIAMAAAEEMVRQAKEASRGDEGMKLGDLVILAGMGILVLVLIGAAFVTSGALNEMKEIQRAQYREQLSQRSILDGIVDGRIPVTTGPPRAFPAPT